MTSSTAEQKHIKFF